MLDRCPWLAILWYSPGQKEETSPRAPLIRCLVQLPRAQLSALQSRLHCSLLAPTRSCGEGLLSAPDGTLFNRRASQTGWLDRPGGAFDCPAHLSLGTTTRQFVSYHQESAKVRSDPVSAICYGTLGRTLTDTGSENDGNKDRLSHRCTQTATFEHVQEEDSAPVAVDREGLRPACGRVWTPLWPACIMSSKSCAYGWAWPFVSCPALHVATRAYHANKTTRRSQTDRHLQFSPALRQDYAPQHAAVCCACSFHSAGVLFRASREPPALAPAAQHRCSRAIFVDPSKTSARALPPFPNRTRLSCATNLNITPLISQARDMKPAVGSPSSVLEACPRQLASSRFSCCNSRLPSRSGPAGQGCPPVRPGASRHRLCRRASGPREVHTGRRHDASRHFGIAVI